MFDVSLHAAAKAAQACEAALADLKAGDPREGNVEGTIKLQFAWANSIIDHAGRALGRDPWTPPFNPPRGNYAAEQGERERVMRFDPPKSGAFIRALEDNLKAMKAQLAAVQ